MRSLFHLLTLVALLLAPLAAPAAASGPVRSAAAECQDMGMGQAEHEMPAGDHDGGACCVAVCAAVVAQSSVASEIDQIGHVPFQSLAAPFRLGSGPSTDDPPPRFA